MSYTHDLYGTFFSPVFALRTASFANEAFLPFRSSLKVAHDVGPLCEMSNGFLLATKVLWAHQAIIVVEVFDVGI